MSSENVETVRVGLESFGRNQGLDPALFDAEVELSNLRESPLPGPYRGHEGLGSGAMTSWKSWRLVASR